jgi:AcrR family transcriptional regulator
MASTPASSPATARRGPAPRLTREAIADAALEIVDREGIAALTMRRLAGELGTGTMTLYGYFANKEQLLDYAVDRGARRFDFSGPDGPWRARLRALIGTIMRALIEHPSAVEIRASRPILHPGALRAGETGMQILREAGFETADAAAAWRLLFTFTFGYAAFSATEPSADQQAEWRRQLSELPVDEYPVMAREATVIVPWMAGRRPFEQGLELILDGLEARLAARRR